MARKKEISYRGNSLVGAHLTESDCAQLDEIYWISSQDGYAEDLEPFRHIIRDLDETQVDLVQKGYSLTEVPDGRLKDYQLLSFAFALKSKRLILGDSVGLGKTVTASAVIRFLTDRMYEGGEQFRALYLCEKTAVTQTSNEIVRFTGSAVEKLQGTKDQVSAFIDRELSGGSSDRSVIGSHSLLTNPAFHDYIRLYKKQFGVAPFDFLVVDESAILSNMATQRYKDACLIRDDFEYILIMNATAFESNLDAFYAQLAFVDPTFLPTKTSFDKEYKVMSYRGMYPKFAGEYKNQAKFKEAIKYRYFSQTRKSLGATMTNCKAEILSAPLTTMQKHWISKSSMPQMVYDDPTYFDKSLYFDEETVPKLRLLMTLFDTDLVNAETVLIYAHYKETQYRLQEYLLNEGISTEVLNGESSIAERDRIISEFQKGGFRVLVTNVQKGLNFGNCDHCVFYTYDPNPNRMVQFVGRMTRSFNIVGKSVYVLLMQGKEEKRFQGVISDRAKASDDFAGSDFSLVLTLLIPQKTLQKEPL